MHLAVRPLTSGDLDEANRICMAAYASPHEHRSELLSYWQMQPDGWFVVTRTGDGISPELLGIPLPASE